MSEDNAKKPAPAANRPNCLRDRGEKRDCKSEELVADGEVFGGSFIVPFCSNAICVLMCSDTSRRD